jgi:hypothetical protein
MNARKWSSVDRTATKALHRSRALTLAALTMASLAAAVLAPGTASAASCGGTAYAPPSGVVFTRNPTYGPESVTNVGIIGSPGHRQGYSFTVQGNFKTPVAVQAWGFDGSGHGKWYPLGVVSSSGGNGAVPWGNVLALPKLRAASGGGNGVLVTWRC